MTYPIINIIKYEPDVIVCTVTLNNPTKNHNDMVHAIIEQYTSGTPSIIHTPPLSVYGITVNNHQFDDMIDQLINVHYHTTLIDFTEPSYGLVKIGTQDLLGFAKINPNYFTNDQILKIY